MKPDGTPYILGLTGSIGMGKSTTARFFSEAGIPVFDSDAEVHRLYEKGGAAVKAIAKRFPGVVVEGEVSRPALSKALSEDASGFKDLEAIVHPLVGARRQAFLSQATSPLVVFDVPLLFETGGEKRVDGVLVVTAPAKIQRERVLAREGMSEDRFKAILSRQMPDAEKRKRADFIIDTSLGLDAARKAVDELISKLITLSNQA